ncbi:MAG TPA: hypothetical protein VGB42_05235 [Candidatus Thermoplasmatota archaeon]
MSQATPAAPYPARPFHRPVGVAVLAVILIVVGFIVALAGLVAVLALGVAMAVAFGPTAGLLGAAAGFVVLLLGAATLVAGLGLWRMQSWAWWLAVVVLLAQILFGIGGWVIPAILLLYLILVRRHFNQ